MIYRRTSRPCSIRRSASDCLQVRPVFWPGCDAGFQVRTKPRMCLQKFSLKVIRGASTAGQAVGGHFGREAAPRPPRIEIAAGRDVPDLPRARFYRLRLRHRPAIGARGGGTGLTCNGFAVPASLSVRAGKMIAHLPRSMTAIRRTTMAERQSLSRPPVAPAAAAAPPRQNRKRAQPTSQPPLRSATSRPNRRPRRAAAAADGAPCAGRTGGRATTVEALGVGTFRCLWAPTASRSCNQPQSRASEDADYPQGARTGLPA